MSQTDIEILQTALEKQWPGKANEKAKAYIGKFFDRKRKGTAVIAKVDGNHGTYTYFHELGATKLACLWVLEHFTPSKS